MTKYHQKSMMQLHSFFLDNHLTNQFAPGIFGSLCESTCTHLQETQPSVYFRVTDAGRICSRSRTSVSVYSLLKYTTVVQAEVFAILACAHDIKAHGITEQHLFALTVWRP
jgi:hypothetical protein